MRSYSCAVGGFVPTAANPEQPEAAGVRAQVFCSPSLASEPRRGDDKR